MNELKQSFYTLSNEFIDDTVHSQELINYSINKNELKRYLFDRFLVKCKLSSYTSYANDELKKVYDIIDFDSSEFITNFDPGLKKSAKELNMKTVSDIWDKYITYSNESFKKFLIKLIHMIEKSNLTQEVKEKIVKLLNLF